MKNAALDILNARYIAISNDLEAKEQESSQKEQEYTSLIDNVAILQSALIDIGLAIKIVEGKLNESVKPRSSVKSKKATP